MELELELELGLGLRLGWLNDRSVRDGTPLCTALSHSADRDALVAGAEAPERELDPLGYHSGANSREVNGDTQALVGAKCQLVSSFQRRIEYRRIPSGIT